MKKKVRSVKYKSSKDKDLPIEGAVAKVETGQISYIIKESLIVNGKLFKKGDVISSLDVENKFLEKLLGLGKLQK